MLRGRSSSPPTTPSNIWDRRSTASCGRHSGAGSLWSLMTVRPTALRRSRNGMPWPIRGFRWSRPNGGVAQARNQGLAATDPQTELVVLLDSDDIWEPTVLSRRFAGSTRSAECVAVHVLAYCIDSQGRPLVGDDLTERMRREGVRRSRDQVAAPRRTDQVRRARGPELDRDTRPPPHEARNRRTRRRVRSDRRPRGRWDFASDLADTATSGSSIADCCSGDGTARA